MATVQKFDTANRAGGRQFVAHGVIRDGFRFSLWFSDHDGGSLVDAERFDGKSVPHGVKRDGTRWMMLAGLVPSLIAQYEREAAAYLNARREPDHAAI